MQRLYRSEWRSAFNRRWRVRAGLQHIETCGPHAHRCHPNSNDDSCSGGFTSESRYSLAGLEVAPASRFRLASKTRSQEEDSFRVVPIRSVCPHAFSVGCRVLRSSGVIRQSLSFRSFANRRCVRSICLRSRAGSQYNPAASQSTSWNDREFFEIPSMVAPGHLE